MNNFKKKNQDKKENKKKNKENILKIQNKIIKIKKKIKEINLRTQAKIENYKKKIILQKEIICKKKIEFFLRELITINDYFEDFIFFINKVLYFKKKSIKGVILISQTISKIFKKFNVETIKDIQKPINYIEHINIIDKKNKKKNLNNQIKSIIKKGYKINNSILRKSIVETYL